MNRFPKTLFLQILAFILVAGLAIAFVGRGPNYTVDWTREVPSKEAITALTPALKDARNWPIFYHALKSATLFQNGKPVEDFDHVTPGMTALFAIEPKAKEWKRFDIRAQVMVPREGEMLHFKMLEESSGKTTRLLEGFEWWIGIREATAEEKKLGNLTYVVGGASAITKTARARFFGRFAPKIFMNQLYQIDLVRLANFTENQASSAKEKDPVYR